MVAPYHKTSKKLNQQPSHSNRCSSKFNPNNLFSNNSSTYRKATNITMIKEDDKDAILSKISNNSQSKTLAKRLKCSQKETLNQDLISHDLIKVDHILAKDTATIVKGVIETTEKEEITERVTSKDLIKGPLTIVIECLRTRDLIKDILAIILNSQIPQLKNLIT